MHSLSDVHVLVTFEPLPGKLAADYSADYIHNIREIRQEKVNPALEQYKPSRTTETQVRGQLAA